MFLYEVDTAAHDAFHSVYGSDGEWARFFAAGEGYEYARRNEAARPLWRREEDVGRFDTP